VTEGEHTIRMFCTDDSEESNCHKIGLGKGVAGTILEMPQGLWSGALRRGQGHEAVKEAGYPPSAGEAVQSCQFPPPQNL